MKAKKIGSCRTSGVKLYLLNESGYETEQSPCFMLLLPFLALTVHKQQ